MTETSPGFLEGPIPHPLSSFFSVLTHVIPSLSFRCLRLVSHLSHVLLPLSRQFADLEALSCLWGCCWVPGPDPLLAPQPCRGGMRSRVQWGDPASSIQGAFSVPLGCTANKQKANYLEEQGILAAAICSFPSDALLIWGPNLNWKCFQGCDSVSWDWHNPRHDVTAVQAQCTLCSE